MRTLFTAISRRVLPIRIVIEAAILALLRDYCCRDRALGLENGFEPEYIIYGASCGMDSYSNIAEERGNRGFA